LRKDTGGEGQSHMVIKRLRASLGLPSPGGTTGGFLVFAEKKRRGR